AGTGGGRVGAGGGGGGGGWPGGGCAGGCGAGGGPAGGGGGGRWRAGQRHEAGELAVHRSAAGAGWAPAWIVSRPLLTTPTRPARRAIAESCVTRTRLSPRSRHSFSSRLMISSRVSSSRLPVGSSASSTLGSFTSAPA